MMKGNLKTLLGNQEFSLLLSEHAELNVELFRLMMDPPAVSSAAAIWHDDFAALAVSPPPGMYRGKGGGASGRGGGRGRGSGSGGRGW